MNTPIKIFVLFLLSMGVTLTSEAQTKDNNSQDSESIRIFGGVNRSLMGGVELKPQEAYYLPSVGLSYTFLCSSSYGISIGFSYEGKGTKKVPSFNLTHEPHAGTTYQRLNYLTIPIQGIYQLEANNKTAIRIKGGVYYSYLLKWVEIVDDRMAEPSKIRIKKETKSLKRSDYGLLAGVEAIYSLKQNFAVSLQLLHNEGIRNIVDSDGFINPLRTNATQLTMGLVYKL